MVKKGNKYQVDSSNSDSESNYEPIGRQFIGIWKEIELGEEVSHGVYRGRCIHCNKEFRHAKPMKTRVHIAHECPIHECTSSIIRLKKCLEEIRNEFANQITNNKVITILKSCEFFDNIQYLTEILIPIKFAILEVEESQSNLADCYIALLKIGAIINELPQREYHEFRNYCIQSLGKTQESFESLITQLREYKIQEHSDGTPNAYAMPYTINQNTPLSWWTTCEVNPNELQCLAMQLFAITPSSAACERTFSALSWLYGKRRQRMNIQTLENIAKVHRFNISQTESKARQIENDELSSNTEFYDSEKDNDSQDEEIDQLLTLNSTNTTANDLELEIKTFIDFDSQIFNSSNNNKDDLIDNKNFGNREENFEDYNSQTIIENMKLDE
ncbi:3866_t:CDS:2, partial [Cetraspora pellucida]